MDKEVKQLESRIAKLEGIVRNMARKNSILENLLKRAISNKAANAHSRMLNIETVLYNNSRRESDELFK